MTNNWRFSNTAVLASLLLTAGCGPGFDSSPDEELEATSNAIVGGQTDQGHDAVAMLYYDDGNNSYLCSGTMIDKRRRARSRFSN